MTRGIVIVVLLVALGAALEAMTGEHWIRSASGQADIQIYDLPGVCLYRLGGQLAAISKAQLLPGTPCQ